MKRIVVVVLVAMSVQLARGAEAPGVIDRPGSGNGPTKVSTGIWIVDITAIDSAQQNFHRRHSRRAAVEGRSPCPYGNRTGALRARSSLDSTSGCRE